MINNSRTIEPIKIIMSFLSFLDNLLEAWAYFKFFKKSVDNFEIAHMLNFCLGCISYFRMDIILTTINK